MKIKIFTMITKIFHTCIFFILSFAAIASAQGYFYEGRYIKLEERYDGIAVVSKMSAFNMETLKAQIENILDGRFKLIGITDNFAYMKSGTKLNESEINSVKKILNSQVSNIKFVSAVYYGESKSVTQIPTDEFIVKLRSADNLARLELLNIQNNVYIKGKVDAGRAFLLKTNDLNSLNALELSDIYYATGLFEYAEPNFVYPAEGFFNWSPNDTYYGLQWHLNNTGQSVSTEGYTAYGDALTSNGFTDADMDVDLAWDYVKGNQNVIVAVFDTGVDSLHPDLKDNLIVGYNAYANTNTNTTDPGSHGTCCIGLIGARSNNNTGVSGIVGGDNGSNHCKICSYRLVDNAGAFTTSANIARAFDTARVRGVHVSSNSWGGGSVNSTLTNAINNLANNGRGGLGCVVLFSSGNDGRNPPNYPSYLSSVVCVGASTTIDSKKSPGTGDQFWWGGCYGEDSNGDLDIVAPTITTTTDIRGTGGYNTAANGDYYNTFNGTSCSCPNAAGVTALIFSVNPNLTKNQVIDYLYRGCDKIDNIPYSTNKTFGKWSPYTGYGRVNAYNSVRLAAGIDVTPPSVNHSNSQVVTSSTYPIIISAEILDQDGSSVPVSGSNAPLLYYRKNPNNLGWSSYTSVNASSNSGNTFYFKIPSSGWQTEIQYYFLVKDNSGNQSLFPKNAPDYPCYTAVGTSAITSGTFPAFSLPSSGVAISSNLNIAGYKMLNVSITLNLTHTYLSDMILQLWSPLTDTKINRVCLFSENGGDGDNISGAVVSDAGSNFWRESTPPYTSLSAKPDHYFKSFLGQNSGGNWKLLYYDGQSGDGGNLSSAVLNITRLSGSTSAAIQKDSELDSLVNFFAYPGATDTMNYYLKNKGTSALVISSYNFSGTYAADYTVINTPVMNVPPNDSTLFRIVLTRNTVQYDQDSRESDISPDFNEASLNIVNNDPSKSNFQITLYNDAPLPVSLASFTSLVNGRDIRLTWKTESETNNAGFDVERSPSGLNQWVKAGYVAGKGNSSSPVSYTFEDKKLNSGKYNYRLKQVDHNGNFEYFALSNVAEVGLPTKFDLSQNYPNPFNPVTKIDFSLPLDAMVSIKLYDITGREVKTLVNDARTAGYYTVQFNASELSSGTYFYRIMTKSSGADYIMTKKLVLIK